MIQIKIYGKYTTGKQSPEQAALLIAEAVNKIMNNFRIDNTDSAIAVEIQLSYNNRKKVKVIIES